MNGLGCEGFLPSAESDRGSTLGTTWRGGLIYSKLLRIVDKELNRSDRSDESVWNKLPGYRFSTFVGSSGGVGLTLRKGPDKAGRVGRAANNSPRRIQTGRGARPPRRDPRRKRECVERKTMSGNGGGGAASEGESGGGAGADKADEHVGPGSGFQAQYAAPSGQFAPGFSASFNQTLPGLPAVVVTPKLACRVCRSRKRACRGGDGGRAPCDRCVRLRLVCEGNTFEGRR